MHRPILTKDRENVQRRVTKFILNDYKTRLVKLHVLPLAMLYELNDICFFMHTQGVGERSEPHSLHVSIKLFRCRTQAWRMLILIFCAQIRKLTFFECSTVMESLESLI